MVCRYISGLHIWNDDIQILEPQMFPFRHFFFQGRPFTFQQDNAKLHTAGICSRRVSVLNWSACSPDFFRNWKHLAHHKIKNMKTNMTQNYWQARIACQTRMGKMFFSPAAALLSSQMFTDCCLKKRGCHTVINTGLSQFFCCYQIQNEYFLT